jgi:hypothetical protein
MKDTELLLSCQPCSCGYDGRKPLAERAMAKKESSDRHLQEYEEWFLDNRFAYVSLLKAVQSLHPAACN